MSQKENLRDHFVSLHKAKNYLAEKLGEESDRLTRDALFGAKDSIGLAILFLEQVEYRTDGAYSQES
jgi:hypothetical protein